MSVTACSPAPHNQQAPVLTNGMNAEQMERLRALRDLQHSEHAERLFASWMCRAGRPASYAWIRVWSERSGESVLDVAVSDLFEQEEPSVLPQVVAKVRALVLTWISDCETDRDAEERYQVLRAQGA